jgi:hypothetical protein
MNYIFHELIGKIVEIYINDVMIESLDHESHLDDVKRTLECTRKHGLKMNPNKCEPEHRLEEKFPNAFKTVKIRMHKLKKSSQDKYER